MNASAREKMLQKAVSDICDRSLAALPGRLSRLLYLASTRDYNTGHYFHDGLAGKFTPAIAESALGAAHSDVFREFMEAGMEGIVDDLTSYVNSLSDPSAVLATWRTLHPYRVILPKAVDPLLAELFCSNIRIALELLNSHSPQPGQSPV